MEARGMWPLLFFLVLLVLPSFVFGQLFTAALIKLKLEPTTALPVVIGIFLGSPINIPVKRVSREESVWSDPLAVFGLQGWWPSPQRFHRETIIAVNAGGCVIPVALAIDETAHLAAAGRQALVGSDRNRSRWFFTSLPFDRNACVIQPTMLG